MDSYRRSIAPGAARQDAPAGVAGARYARLVQPSVHATTPTAEQPALSDEERAKRLALLAERLRDPDGLDRGTLAQIERLTGDER